MAQTIDEIKAQLRIDHPEILDDVAGVTIPRSPEDYEATLDEWAAVIQAKQIAAEDQTAKRDDRKQLRLAMTTLASDRDTLDADYADITNAQLPLTVAQLRPYMARANRVSKHTSLVVSGLISALVGRGIIEPDS